jgi:hypothetical protein
MVAEVKDQPKGSPSVFLQDFVDVGVAAAEAGERLASGGTWLAPLATAAGDDATSLLVRVGPARMGEFVARTVLVRLGEPSARGDVVMVPIRWEDAQHPALFPVLDGDLEVAPLDVDRCRVVLYAAYRPPLRAVGRLIDDALLHRVAESTVRAFLHRAAQALTAPLSGLPSGALAEPAP